MITKIGKGIITKYLIGQAPAYASYVAVGCGPNAISGALGDYSNKTSLDFEMFRVPIISRGFVTEDGINKVVLTAELPTEERYEITEIGVYSAGSNPSAGSYDSRNLFSFTENENWEHHTTTAAGSIDSIITPLNEDSGNNTITTTKKVFQTNADNVVFTNTARLNRNERCRFLNNIIVMSGDSSKIDMLSSGKLDLIPTWGTGQNIKNSSHIHLNGTPPDFNKQSPKDEIRLAFSVINKNGTDGTKPKKIRLMVEFAENDAYSVGEYARFEVDISHIDNDPVYDFSNNRYFVVSKKLEELTKTSAFAWGSMQLVKIYACVLDQSDQPSENFLVCLDAIRLENTYTQNPLYGLTGYSVVKNTNARPIIKSANTSNFIEFRFNVGVA
jgi:hypothetical protein